MPRCLSPSMVCRKSLSLRRIPWPQHSYPSGPRLRWLPTSPTPTAPPYVGDAYQDYLRQQQRRAPSQRRPAKKYVKFDSGGVLPPPTPSMPRSSRLLGGGLPGPSMPSIPRVSSPGFPELGLMPDLSADLDEDESYSEVQVYWRKAAGLAYVTAGTDLYLYTKPLPTPRFREVVAQFHIDADIPPNSSIVVAPQVSNDMTTWDTQSALTTVSPGGTYPKVAVSKYTTIGAFMRFQIKLTLSAGAATVGGTFEIVAVGRK